MPVFTFEKISPPDRRGPQPSSPPAPAKPRGMIIQMLDRLVETRVKRTAVEGKPGDQHEPDSQK